MKKNIIILLITIAISTHLNAMEPEIPPCLFNGMPADIMDYIATFLTFDDVETEEEFINRKKGPSSQPTRFYSKTKTITIEEEEEMDFGSTEDSEGSKLICIRMRKEEVENSQEEICPEEPTEERFLKDRVMPCYWLQNHKATEGKFIENLYFVIYSPNNTVCAMTYGGPNEFGFPDHAQPSRISIVNTKTNQEIHNISAYKKDKTKRREKYFQNLAISCCGNIYATLYIKKIDKNVGFQCRIKIKNLQTQKKEYPVFPAISGSCETIAFNKQGTHLIMHKVHRDRSTNKDVLNHAIIALTTTLENNAVPQKTLSHYFAQKGICKDLAIS